MGDPIIHTEGLSRSFGAVRAVNELSLDVPAGIIFGFLGPNGSGKTTTIHLLLGLLEPSAGQGTVAGFDIRTHADAVRRHAGALLEHAGLYERLSAEDNLEFRGRIYNIPAGERRARIHELLDHVGLWERRKEPIGTWSRGMKQKLAVTQACFHRPQLIFLDEPSAGLDPVAAAAFRDDLRALVEQEGVTVFLTTHNLAEAEKLCARVAVIREGTLIAEGSPDELRHRRGGVSAEIIGKGFDEHILSRVRTSSAVAQAEARDGRMFVTLNGDASLAPLVRLIVESGGEVEEAHKGNPSLEEVFLTLMEKERP